MSNITRSIGFSLCALVGSIVPRDSAAMFPLEEGNLGYACGDRLDSYYFTSKGDNLWNLSHKVYGSTMEFSYESGKLVSYPQVIARANRLKNYEIQEGQHLVIPRGDVIRGGECPADTKARPASEYHDVRELGEL